MRHVVGLPDLHPGKGTPVGAAFITDTHIYPHLVGNDIGCGMSFWETDHNTVKIKLDRWTKDLDSLEGSWDGNVSEWLNQYGINQLQFQNSLGTIGGGNHFAELQKVEEIVDLEAFESLKLNKKAVYLLVHSGSRGLGEQILQNHINSFNVSGIPSGSPDAANYLKSHDFGVLWAKANRDLIAKRFSNCIRTTANKILDVTHNYVHRIAYEGREYWIHRKGATPADLGPVIIPGSRGDFSYLVIPKNADFMSGFSLAHGAGRKWTRSDAKKKLGNYRMEDFIRTALGSNVICECKELIFEEAPQAYKKINVVVQDLVDHDLVKIVAIFRPLITYKTRRFS
jgi:release factor H-coupled RctB family protein